MLPFTHIHTETHTHNRTYEGTGEGASLRDRNANLPDRTFIAEISCLYIFPTAFFYHYLYEKITKKCYFSFCHKQIFTICLLNSYISIKSQYRVVNYI